MKGYIYDKIFWPWIKLICICYGLIVIWRHWYHMTTIWPWTELWRFFNCSLFRVEPQHEVRDNKDLYLKWTMVICQHFISLGRLFSLCYDLIAFRAKNLNFSNGIIMTLFLNGTGYHITTFFDLGSSFVAFYGLILSGDEYGKITTCI